MSIKKGKIAYSITLSKDYSSRLFGQEVQSKGDDYAHLVIIGGLGNDVIYGTRGKDTLYGGHGHDKIKGLNGNDKIKGGKGNDKIWGGKHKDRLFGDHGKDKIKGGDHDDKIKGGKHNDKIWGGKHKDKLWGDHGSDIIRGGTHDDKIWGGSHNDRLYGDNGNDVIRGGTHNDLIYGGNNNDTLLGDSGADTIYGGHHNDKIWGGSENDRLYGQSGQDVLKGGTGNDLLRGGADKDFLYGENGSDKLYGEAGDDTLNGGRGLDTMDGGSGRDTLIVNLNTDLDFTTGKESIHGGSDVDTLVLQFGQQTRENLEAIIAVAKAIVKGEQSSFSTLDTEHPLYSQLNKMTISGIEQIRLDDGVKETLIGNIVVDFEINTLAEDNVSAGMVVMKVDATDLDNDPLTLMLNSNQSGYFALFGSAIVLTEAGVTAINNDALDITSLDISLDVTDGTYTEEVMTSVTVVRIDDTPEVSINALSVIEDQGSKLITTEHLSAQHVSDDPNKIIYQVASMPEGILYVGLDTFTSTDTAEFTQWHINNGLVAFQAEANLDESDEFELVVYRDNDDGREAVETISLPLNITPVNDAPRLDSGAVTIGLGASKGDFVYRLSADDVDSHDTHTYAILGGNLLVGEEDTPVFSIDETTGAITVNVDDIGHYINSGHQLIVMTTDAAGLTDQDGWGDMAAADIPQPVVTINLTDNTKAESHLVINITQVDDATVLSVSGYIYDFDSDGADGETGDGTLQHNDMAIDYHWLRDGVEIDGATASTYTLIDEDNGASISVRATFVDDVGVTETVYTLNTIDVSEDGGDTDVNYPPSLSLLVTEGSIIDVEEEASMQQDSNLMGSGTINDTDGDELTLTVNDIEIPIIDMMSPPQQEPTELMEPVQPAEIAGTYGTLVVSRTPLGQVHYFFNKNAAAIEELNTGDNRSEVFVFELSDGKETVSQTYTVNITGADEAPDVNLAPTLTLTTLSINEDKSISLNGVTVGDADGDILTVTLSVTGGDFDTSAMSVNVIDSQSAGHLVLSGSVAALNTALSEINYTPAENSHTNETLAVTVSDGVNSDVTETTPIAITAQNDMHQGDVSITVSIDADGSTTPSEGDVLQASHTLTDVDVDGSLSVTYTWYRVNEMGPDVELTSGTDVYLVQSADMGADIYVQASYVDEHGSQTVDSQTLAVDAPVNSPASLMVPVTLSINEDESISLNGVTVGDADGDILTVTLSVTGGDFDTSAMSVNVIDSQSAGHLVLSGSVAALNTALSEINYTPAENSHTNETLAVTVSDGVNSDVTETTPIAITAQNDMHQGDVSITVSIDADGSTTPSEGDVLQASHTLTDVDVDGSLSVTYTWYRVNEMGPDVELTSGTDVYLVQSADMGADIYVQASYVDEHGSQTVDSQTLAVDAQNNAPTLELSQYTGSIDEITGTTNTTDTHLTGTVAQDDVDGDALTLTVTGPSGDNAKTIASGTVTINGVYGDLDVTRDAVTGEVSYRYMKNDLTVEALNDGDTASDAFEFNLFDGEATVSQTYMVNFNGANEANSVSGNGPYILTPESTQKAGAKWYEDALDFTRDFTITALVYFGHSQAQEGGDGMAIGLQRASQRDKDLPTGDAKGVLPGMYGFVVDTFINSDDVGATGDFAAALSDGIEDSSIINIAQVENGLWHSVEVSFDKDTHILSYALKDNTGTIIYTSSQDISGRDTSEDYYFGVTASTGNAYNEQMVDNYLLAYANEVPNFTSSATASINENTIDVMMVTAEDPESQTVTYSLTGGEDLSLFDIDANTGVLSFKEAPDYDLPGDNSYQVTVQAFDGTQSAEQTITVNVNDVAASIDVIVPEFQIIDLAEGGSETRLPGIDGLLGTADDQAVNLSSISLNVATSITLGASERLVITSFDELSSTLHTFDSQINTAEGVYSLWDKYINLTVNVAEDGSISYQFKKWTLLDQIQQGDDGINKFNFYAFDSNVQLDLDLKGELATPHDNEVAAQSVTVEVIGANDVPDAVDDTIHFDLSTSQTSFTANLLSNDSDKDLNDTLTTTATMPTSFSDGVVSIALYPSTFSLDSNGLLTFDASNGEFAYLNAGQEVVVTVEYTATDMAGAEDSATATITVVGKDDAPYFSPEMATAYDIFENTTVVTSVLAYDAEKEAVTYSITGNDAHLFNIDAITGELSFKVAPDFDSPSDTDGNNVYDVTIVGSSNGTDGIQSTEQSIEVTVKDVDASLDVIYDEFQIYDLENGGSEARKPGLDGNYGTTDDEVTLLSNLPINLFTSIPTDVDSRLVITGYDELTSTLYTYDSMVHTAPGTYKVWDKYMNITVTVASDGTQSFQFKKWDKLDQINEGDDGLNEFHFYFADKNATLNLDGQGRLTGPHDNDIATETVSVNVVGANDVPVTRDDVIVIDEDEVLSGFNLIGNDSDVDLGDSISLASFIRPNSYTLNGKLIEQYDGGGALIKPFAFSQLVAYNSGNISFHPMGTSETSLTPPETDLSYLYAGQEAELVVIVNAEDSHGATSSSEVTIKVKGRDFINSSGGNNDLDPTSSGGTYTKLGNGEHQLTSGSTGDGAGSMWYGVDLSRSFEMTANVYFGTNDAGADGLVVGLQKHGATSVGDSGDTLGIVPTMYGLAIDTFDNLAGDPPTAPHGGEDFGVVVVNGAKVASVDAHEIIEDGYEFENGQMHEVLFQWDATTGSFYAEFTHNDGDPLTTDIYRVFTKNNVTINEVNLATEYFVGFTAANGDKLNEHKVDNVSITYQTHDVTMTETAYTGHAYAEVITGTGLDDTINGKGGNDVINADVGADKIIYSLTDYKGYHHVKFDAHDDGVNNDELIITDLADLIQSLVTAKNSSDLTVSRDAAYELTELKDALTKLAVDVYDNGSGSGADSVFDYGDYRLDADNFEFVTLHVQKSSGEDVYQRINNEADVVAFIADLDDHIDEFVETDNLF